MRTAIGITCNQGAGDPSHFENLSGVGDAIRVSVPRPIKGRKDSTKVYEPFNLGYQNRANHRCFGVAPEFSHLISGRIAEAAADRQLADAMNSRNRALNLRSARAPVIPVREMA